MYELPHADAPPASSPAERSRQGRPVEPARIARALSRGRYVIAATALVGLVLGVALAKLVVAREYVTDATLLVSAPASSAGSTDAARHLRTVADSLKSPGTLERVRRRGAVTESLEKLGKSIQLDAAPDANLVVVKVTRSNAEQAARIANAATAEFIQVRLEVETARIESDRAHLDDELARAHAKLDAAHQRREAFRDKHALSDVPAELRVALEQAARHTSDSESAAALADAERARSKLLTSVAAREPALTVVAEQQISPDATKLAEVEAQLGADRARLGEDHPRMLALRSQAESLRAKVGASHAPWVSSRTVARNPRWETLQQGLSGSASERVAAERRSAAFADLAQGARSRIAELASLQGTMATLDAEVTHAQERVHELDLRRERTLEASHAPRADVSVVAPAVVPARPSKATGRVVALVTPAAMALFAALVTVVSALGGLRVTSGAEAAFWSGLPILASVRGASVEALTGLRADVGQHAEAWKGPTLFVTLADDEVPFARAAAEWLGSDGGAEVASLEALDRADGLRRSARAASRVVVLLRSGRHSAPHLAQIAGRLGCTDGVALVLFGLEPSLVRSRDRFGELSKFIDSVVSSTPTEGART